MAWQAERRGYKAPMDSNFLIQRKRERFADLEGQGEESNTRFAIQVEEPSRLFICNKRGRMPLLLFNSRKLSGSTAATWIRYKRGRLCYFRRRLCVCSALASGKHRGQTEENYRNNGRADCGRDR
jgi:hypothetical protein